jgi:mercuric ion transport protein
MPLSSSVELIYDATCPNVDAARQQLRDALTRAGRPPIWTEWDRAAPGSPAYVRRYASPTVLVAGCDVTGASDLDAGDGCRVYQDGTGTFLRAPSAQTILAVLSAVEGAGR